MNGQRKGITRRRFLAAAATVPLMHTPFWGKVPTQPGPNERLAGSGAVIWTPTSFVVNGRPRFLASGTMDYFRCPASLWRDRILKAKRAGLNTIMTYVAWNQHEPREGEFVFEGGTDLKAFLRTCADLEMLAIVRTGPFMCDEFEMGGYPAWLLAKPGVVLRTRNAVAEPYIERWFERLCDKIVPLQASHGGPVILVQAEDEYYYPDRPGGIEY